MLRPLGVLTAAAITVAVVGGASAADAATRPAPSLPQAAAADRANASTALAGIAVPAPSTGVRADAAHGTPVESVHLTIPVKVRDVRYDVRADSTKEKTDPTRITLYVASQPEQIVVRRFVRLTVTRHGRTTPLLASTTSFRRFVVMLQGLEANPLTGSLTRYQTRAEMVAALTHGLAISGAEVTREYGAVLRYAQMSIDLGVTLLQAAEYLAEHPEATDFTGVPTVQTTAGSGGYTGTVALTGSPTAFTLSATNSTDGSSLTETVGPDAFSITYTVGGKTWTESF